MPQTEIWVHLRCVKCGVEVKVKPADASDLSVLRSLSAEDEEWGDGPGCPMCEHWRGGHYPLVRVLQDGEREAIHELAAARAALDLADREEEPPLPPDDADEATLNAYDQAQNAWCDRLDVADNRWRDAQDRLKAMGYTAEDMIAIQDAAPEGAEVAPAPR